jgi:hypothetical protein
VYQSTHENTPTRTSSGLGITGQLPCPRGRAAVRTRLSVHFGVALGTTRKWIPLADFDEKAVAGVCPMCGEFANPVKTGDGFWFRCDEHELKWR